MFVIENRAKDGSSPRVFWEITPMQPTDVDGDPVSVGMLPDEGNTRRRVVGTAQSPDALVGLLTNQQIGRVRPQDVERAWKNASAFGPAERSRVVPRMRAAPAQLQPTTSAPSPFAGRVHRERAGAASATATESAALAMGIVAAFFVLAVAIWILAI